MKLLLFILALKVFLAFSQDSGDADVDLTPHQEVNKYMWNISVFHELIAVPKINNQEQTCNFALEFISAFQGNMFKDIVRAMASIDHHYRLIGVLLQDHTSAADCMQNVWESHQEEKKEETGRVLRCVQSASTEQREVKKKTNENSNAYVKVMQKIPNNLMKCNDWFPNEDRKIERRECFENGYKEFIGPFNVITEEQGSPCMDTFEQTVLECVTTSSERIAQTIKDFPGKLKQCAILTDDPETISIADSLKSTEYQPKIREQIKEAQKNDQDLRNSATTAMRVYYKLLTKADNFRLLDLSPEVAFRKVVDKLFAPYFQSLEEAIYNNLQIARSPCTNKARNELNAIIELGTENYRKCYQKVALHTNYITNSVFRTFKALFYSLASLGNAGILKCLKDEPIFVKDTIKNCYNKEHRSVFRDAYIYLKNIDNSVKELLESNIYFDSEILQPCGQEAGSSLNPQAETVINNFKKCRQESFRPNYHVEIPYKGSYPFLYG